VFDGYVVKKNACMLNHLRLVQEGIC